MRDEKIPWVAIGVIGAIFSLIKCRKTKKAVEESVDRIIYVQQYIFPKM